MLTRQAEELIDVVESCIAATHERLGLDADALDAADYAADIVRHLTREYLGQLLVMRPSFWGNDCACRGRA